MSYIPDNHLLETTFPQRYGKDILNGIRTVEERWERFYPQIKYHCLNFTPTILPKTTAGDADVSEATGVSGGSAFDALWGEAIDPVALTEAWKQPHVSGSNVASEPEKFMAPVLLHAQIRREAKEKELKKLGFDEVRDLLVTIPLSLLDRAGVEVKVGDRFVWDNDVFDVDQFELTGYWKNTELRVFIVINAKHHHFGS